MIYPNTAIFEFMVVLLASLLLDYPLQCEFLKKYKSTSILVLLIHATMWGLGVSLTVILLRGSVAGYHVVQLVVVHAIIDAWKARGWYRKAGIADHQAYFIDQTAHFLQLLVVLYL